MPRDFRDNCISFQQNLYPFLWKLPITYNPDSGTFYCFKSSNEKWSFILGEVLTFIVGVGTSGFLLVKQLVYPTEEVGMAHYVIYTSSVLGTAITSFIVLQLQSCQTEVCAILNRATHLYKAIPLSEPEPDKTDFLGYFLHIYVCCLFPVTFVMPFIVYFNLDPIFMCCRLLGITMSWKFIEIPLRVSLQTTLFCSALRSLVYASLIAVIYAVKILKAFRSSLVGKLRLGRLSVCTQNIIRFQSYYIYIEYMGNAALTRMIGAALSCTFIFQILFLFVSVRLYELVLFLWPVYVGCILGIFFVPTWMHFAWIQVEKIHYISMTNKDSLVRAVPHFRLSVISKLVRKKIKCLRIHNIYFGLFNLRCFALTSKTEIAYFAIVIEMGINALLSVPFVDVGAHFKINCLKC